MALNFSVSWNGVHAKAVARSASREGLRKAGEHLLAESAKQTPVREGILIGTGQVSVLDDHTTAVHYNTDYAIRQHEELTWRHPQGGKAKYLEDPLNSERETLKALIASTVKDSLE